MHFHLVALAATLASVSTAEYAFSDTSGTDALAAQALANQAHYFWSQKYAGWSSKSRVKSKREAWFGHHGGGGEAPSSHQPSGGNSNAAPASILASLAQPADFICTPETAYRRKEWSALSDWEKLDYIRAIQCLHSLPAESGSLVPGAQSRYDDFLGTHINQTNTIHGTGNFLTWHRYFLYTYEHELRDKCGYRGYLPYLNWGKYAADLEAAPLFDNSDTSVSGNGEKFDYGGIVFPAPPAPPLFTAPPGNGGGCLTGGPFQNFTVNLGPVGHSALVPGVPENPQADGLGYNPRCLRRDLNTGISSTKSTDTNTTTLINSFDAIGDFQNTMNGNFAAGVLGVHAAGHFWIGADPGGDFYTSPGDPYFYLHHAQIDRVYWMWQNQNPWARTYQIAGTRTLRNTPPSDNATIEDNINLGVVDGFGGMQVKDAMRTLGDKFCYVYE